MNRTTIAKGLAVLVAGVMIGGTTVAVATPNDPCESAYTGTMNSTAKLKAYNDCRFDRIDKRLAALDSPSPEPSATSTVTVTPTLTPAPTPAITPSQSTSVTPPATPSATTSPLTVWPNAANTGVPAGTNLTAYTGPMTITQSNTVIDAKTITGNLIIRAANVSITRSKINGTVATDENSTGYRFSITDSEVNAGNREGTGVGAVDFTATRVHIYGGNRSMHCWRDCQIVDSYVHGQFTDTTGRAHESGIRMGKGLVLRHNTIACDAPDVPPDAGCSAALTGYGDFATVENNLIENNLFKAGSGGYCVYGGSSPKPYPNANNIRFIGNRWEKGSSGKCGWFGPVTSFNSSAPGNVWSDNKYTDGTTVQAAN